MQVAGSHGTSSMQPELTQHHGQMVCRTTPAHTYLSLILCLHCSVGAIALISISFQLKLLVFRFFSFNIPSLSSAAVAHLLLFSSICHRVCRSWFVESMKPLGCNDAPAWHLEIQACSWNVMNQTVARQLGFQFIFRLCEVKSSSLFSCPLWFSRADCSRSSNSAEGRVQSLWPI